MKTHKKKIKTILQKSVICFVALTTILSMTSIPYLAPLEIKTAQATTPTILVVEQVNPSAVEVIFSEAMDETTSQTPGNYTFSGGLTVVDAVQQNSNIFRVVASGEITAGVGGTTLTVSANVLADDGVTNNATTTPQTIVRPVRVKISEVSAEMGSESAEFIEIYNAGSDATDISGWLIQYDEATSDGWTTIATINDSTNISAGGFYLFSTTAFDGASATDGDQNFTATLPLAGGHIRLANGSTEIDKIGWGSADSAEGNSPASAHIANQSCERKAFGGSQAVDLAASGMDETMGNGWDTNDNSFDFVVQGTPNPQNSSSTAEQQDFSGGGGPMINHMPVNSAVTGSDLEITAQMGDPATAISNIVAELHYMAGDGTPAAISAITDFTTILGTHQSNGFFKFTIPQTVVNTVGGAVVKKLYYYLKVVTDGGTGFMSASATADTGTYDTVALQEAAVAVNPFIINVAGAGTTYAISGQVIDEASNGINGVLVMIEGTGYSATTATDGATVGKYSISVPNGIYNLTMVMDGYYEEWINDIFVNGSAVTVNRTMYAGTGGGTTGDSEKPIVMWTGPPDGMMGIPSRMADFKIFVGFSKDIDSTTFTTSNVTLTNNPSGSAEAALTGYTVQYNPTRTGGMPPVEMDPYLGVISLPSGGAGFTENTTYYLIMNGTIRDTAGNALQGNRPDGGHMISFTAGGTFTNDQMMGDNFGTGAMMPPFVAGTNPYDGAMNVMTNAKININFSDPMDSTTVNSTNIKLYKITYANYSETKTAVSLSSVSLDTSGQNATLTPAVLSAGKYRVVVSGALKSATGIWMGDPGQGHNASSYEFYWSEFEVGSTSDDIPPTVLGSWPANGDINIPVNPGMMTIQFSEGMDPSTINSNTITLKRGTSAVTGNVSYDPMSQSASFSPSVVLATSTDYTLTVTTSVTDAVGVPIASNEIITFTTNAAGDSSAPSIMFANGDEYGLAITFSESMNSANVADSTGYLASVLNPANYIIKQGTAGTTDWTGVGGLVLTNAKFKYDGMGNTVMIDNIPGTTIGNDYYIDMTPATVSGAGTADLSGNAIATGTTFQMPIQNSANTNGMLGPMMGGGGMMGPDMGMMGMMGAGVFPMNAMAGQTTIYFVDIPTTKAIPSGGKIVLTFPVGFDVSGAIKDQYSPVNNDINEWNAGTVTIALVEKDETTRKITITTGTSATQTNDFLHMDIAGIVNSSIPRGFETSGYTVDMKTMDNLGNLLETITAMPFFINEGGSNSLVVTINGVTATDGGDVTVFLGSPMTGPMEQTATFNGVDETSKTVTFSSLLEGQYMLFTEPTITLGTTDYLGMPMPQPIIVDQVGETKTMTLVEEDAGAVAAVTVNITGIPNGDEIDVFAGSPVGFKVKTLTGTGSALSTVLYLPAGNWMVGVGPAMPKGPMAGPPPMPDWMPPMPTTIVSNGSAPQTLDISITTAGMEIVGYVQDGAGNAIADAEAFAYQPMGMGMGSHAKTDTDGKFTLKVATAGTYSVGVFKPGLPGTPDRTVRVFTDGDLESVGSNPVDDGNSTADVEVDNSLIIDVNNNGTEDAGDNLFIFKIQKPDWTISGKVTNGTNPVSYAPVWAYQPNGMGHADTMTDASGNYILYVSNGNWTVQSYIPGYGDSQSQTVVVDGASMTQNLSQDSSVTYYAISGTVTLNDIDQTYMPIRAVEYDSNGNYLGREYGGQTDASGEYSISVPGSASGKYYRVDIWTPEFGEVELTNPDSGLSATPANVIITTASKTGKDIIIASGDLKTVAIKFTNGAVSQTGIVNIDGLSCSGNICNPTGFHKTIKMSALNADSSVQLPIGDYLFFLDVPGAGFYIPDEADAAGNTKHCITVVATPDGYVSGVISLTDNAVEFDLPDSSTELFAVTGTITDSSDSSNIEGAWVWMGNPTTGVHTGAMTNSSGVYTITVKTGTYKMGVEMPGYVPQQPTEIVVSADASEVDYTLTAADQFITGVIYADADNDSTYDSNEEIANGWVWVEETTTKQIAGSPTEVDGTFSIGVVDGTYTLKGVGEGYSETNFGSPITVSGSGSAGNNINLTVDANWSSKLKSRPMTPASGGTLDDSLSSGTGVKIVAPPNALGSGTSSGNIRTKEVSSVSKTNSAEPLGGKGKEITAQDNSGQAITTLNSDIEIELNYYKEDITEAGETDMAKLKLLTNSYWDASVGDWVPLSTTKKAYTKAVGAVASAEWTAQPNFDTFVDDLVSDSDAYGDYKVTLQSTTGHLTIFGGTTPSDLIVPSAPTNLSATAGNNQVVLDWDDNSEVDLMEYEIYRSTSESVQAISANQVNTSQVAVSQYTDTTAQNGITYYYVVTAADSSGNESSVSNEIAAMPVSAGSGGTNPSASASVTAPTTTTGTVEATASAGGETTLTATGNTTAKVEIPANALTQNATVEIVSASTATVAASAPAPTGKSMASAFTITATAGTTSISSFSKAVSLSFTYTDEQISGIDEATLKIYRWNGTEWIVLSSSVNAATNTITAKTTNFSNFAIMGDLTGTGTVELVDGDVARIGSAAEVYIIKIVGSNKYKRHIVSPEVFNSYGHLSWDAIKSVSSLDAYSLSAWVRSNTGPNETPAATDKVYEVNADSTMHWLNMTAAQFYARGGSDEAIYNINQAELDLYTLGVDVMYQ